MIKHQSVIFLGPPLSRIDLIFYIMVTKVWKDIVLANVGDKFPNVAQRFDPQHKGRLYKRDFFEKLGEVFEAMEYSDSGSVFIWTTNKVWCIRHQSEMEILIYLPRNPPKI